MSPSSTRLIILGACVGWTLMSGAPHVAEAKGIDVEALARPPAKQGGGEADAALIVATGTYTQLPRLPGVEQVVSAWQRHLVEVRGIPSDRVRTMEATDVADIKKAAIEAAAKSSGGTCWLILVGHGTVGGSGSDAALALKTMPADGADAGKHRISLAALSEATRRGPKAVVALVDTGYSDKRGNVFSWQRKIKDGDPLAPNMVALVGADQDGAAHLMPKLRRPALTWLMLGLFRGWGDKNRDKSMTIGELDYYASRALPAALLSGQRARLIGSGPRGTVLARKLLEAPDDGDAWLTQLNAAYSQLPFSGGEPLLPPNTPLPKVPAIAGIIAGLAGYTAIQKLVEIHKDPKATPTKKADVWCGVAQSASAVPYGRLATRGCALWRQYAKSHGKYLNRADSAWAKVQSVMKGGVDKGDVAQKLATVGAFLVVYGVMGKTARTKLARRWRDQLLGRVRKEKPKRPQKATKTAKRDETKACSGAKARACMERARKLAAAKRTRGEACALFAQSCPSAAEGCFEAGNCWQTGVGVERNAKRAASLYGEGCKHKHGESCGRLGMMQEFGEAQEADITAALASYNDACARNVAWACTSAAVLGFQSNPDAATATRSLALLRKACDAGDGQGCVSGAVLRRGLAGANAEPEAYQMLRAGCRVKHEGACAQQGLCLLEGRGVARDPKRAVALLTRGCKANAAGACAALRLAEADGFAGAKASEQAAERLSRACGGGDLVSCKALAGLYRRGQTVKSDRTKAIGLYGKGCGAGDGQACDALCATATEGQLVRHGLSTIARVCELRCQQGGADGCAAVAQIRLVGARDVTGAYSAWQKACDAGSGLGCLLLGRMFVTGMPPVSKTPQLASRRLGQSCDAGMGRGCAALAGMHLRGELSSTPDVAKAMSLLERGCGLRDGAACGALAKMNAEGVGAAADAKQAKMWAERACRFGLRSACAAGSP